MIFDAPFARYFQFFSALLFYSCLRVCLSCLYCVHLAGIFCFPRKSFRFPPFVFILFFLVFNVGRVESRKNRNCHAFLLLSRIDFSTSFRIFLFLLLLEYSSYFKALKCIGEHKTNKLCCK